MEESSIILHWGSEQFSPQENYCLRVFAHLFKREWLQSDFARYCIENIDHCKYLGGILIDSPWLGPIPPERLSGGTQTLLAYNNKDKVYPISNLGDNCGEALFRSGIESPTQWSWMGYTPPFLPEQRIKIASTGEIVLGKDWIDYRRDNAPDPVTLIPGIKHACDYEEDY